MNNRFPKSIRLLKARDYERVYGRGRAKAGKYIQAFFLENGLGHCRFGISVGKKWGNAVKRNMLKRWIREAIRKRKQSVEPGLDVVVHPKLTSDALCGNSYENEFSRLLVCIESKKEIGTHKESHSVCN